MSKDLKTLEAIIFASNEPVSENDLIDKIDNKKNLKSYLAELKVLYSDRGVNLKKNGDKWSFRTSEDLSENLIILRKKKRKLSRAAIETLAIIAYHQPVTRSEIENIRGVQMGRGSIDHLLEIGWIKPKGRKNVPGKPTLWATTDLFLEHFDLENLQNLPNKEELKASGFLDKRAAISTITDKADEENLNIDQNQDTHENDNLDDFINHN
tara:strand:- start:539 stop:1168 length:630 start_codon:yes stop_codon:yes gene_type:complete